MLDELTSTIADIYPTDADIRRVAKDVGVPVVFLTLDGKAINMASSLVKQAEQRGLLYELVEFAYREYPTNMSLAELFGAVRYPPATDEIRQEYRQKSPVEVEEDLYVMVRKNTSKLDKFEAWMMVVAISSVLSWITLIGIMFALRYIPG